MSPKLQAVITEYKRCRNGMNRCIWHEMKENKTFAAAFAIAMVLLVLLKTGMYLFFTLLGLTPVWAVVAMLVSFKAFKGYRMWVTSKEHP